jgi:hypothetical protein
MKDYRGAPLDAIKLAAAVLMVADHVDTMLLDGAAPSLWRIGRAAYPLFALVCALHLARGADARAYAAGLLLWAVPTQVVYAWAFPYGSTEASILVTLAVGAVLADRLARAGSWRHLAFAAGLSACVAFPSVARTGVDFGLAGMLLPPALLCAVQRPRTDGPWLVAALLALNATGWHPPGESRAVSTLSAAAMGLAAILLALWLAPRLSGRPRLLPTRALALFYPGHLAVLAALRALG